MANRQDIMMRLKAQDHTKKAFNSVKQSLTSTEKGFNQIKKVVAGAFAVGAIVQFSRATIDMAFQLDNTSKKLGINAESLQRLRHVAEQTGVATTTFDMALQRFSRRTAEAAMGTGEARDALRQLGIQLKDSEGKTRSVEELFMELPDAFGKVNSESEKLRLAFKLFDSEGVALKNTLSLTSEQMREMSKIDVLSQSDIDIASEFQRVSNDLSKNTMTLLQKAVVSVANDILKIGEAFGIVEREATAATLRMEIADLENSLKQALGEVPTGGILGAFMSGVGDQFVDPQTGLSDADKIRIKIVQLKEELKNLPDPLSKIGTQFSTTAFGVKNFVEELENVEKSVDKLTVDSMKKFEDSIVKSLKTGKLEFEDFADYVVEQMLRIAIQQMILRPLTGYFESFFGSFGSIFREDGGSVKAGSPYIVGEGGAEMFVPNSSGQIITNENLANMTSPSTQPVSVSFNISTVDASGFDQLLASRKGMITAMINNAMNARGKMGVI